MLVARTWSTAWGVLFAEGSVIETPPDPVRLPSVRLANRLAQHRIVLLAGPDLGCRLGHPLDFHPGLTCGSKRKLSRIKKAVRRTPAGAFLPIVTKT